MMKNKLILFPGLLSLILMFFITCSKDSSVDPGEEIPSGPFQVQGRFLYDAAGEKVILRGVNKMIYYRDATGINSYPEIEQCGANVVRIFWFARDDKSVTELDLTLTNCIKADMIPMIECHDATGKWDQLWTCVNYWRRADVLRVLKKHEEYLLINIANEAGNHDVTDEQFKTEYAKAITALREAGLKCPLVIDAAGWGRGEDYLLDNGQYLLSQDPLKNLIFSWHPWDTNQPQSRYDAAIASSIDKQLCFIVGEVSKVGVFCEKPIDIHYIIRRCHENEIGWLCWSWGPGNSCEEMSMTEDGTFATLHDYGLEVAVTSPYSIQNTAVRPQSIVDRF